MVGKYTELVDSYKSVQEADPVGGIANDVKVEIDWLLSEGFGRRGVETLSSYNGLLIPRRVRSGGVEGMLHAIQWARESGTPFSFASGSNVR